MTESVGVKKQEGFIHHVLQRVSVDGHESYGSGPLVVLFVVMLVKVGMVEQSEGEEEHQIIG